MKLSILFLAFCENCTWEILPMLIGAWLLGWLFWWLFNRPKYQNRITTLENEMGALHTKVTAAPMVNIDTDLEQLNAELAAANQSNESINANLLRLKGDLNESQSRHNSLNIELEKLNRELIDVKKENLDLELKLQACKDDQGKSTVQPVVAVSDDGPGQDDSNDASSDTPDAGYTKKSIYVGLLKSSNLKIVEGVGPKIESLMNAAGIKSWSDLASAPPSKIQTILDEAGPRYRVHDPKTWPEQARLANEDKWEELIAFQKDLSGGKAGVKDAKSASKVEKLFMKARGIKAFAPDDLKIVEGIGPKIEGLLKADGIGNWTDLSNAKLEFIKGVLAAAGERYRLADPSTWPKQAGLAAAGKWEELKAYQDRLKGGKE